MIYLIYLIYLILKAYICPYYLKNKIIMTVRNTIIILILTITYSCNSENNDPSGQYTFTHNCVLMYYKYIDRSPEKYKAAQFLIDNMQYHYSKGKVIKDNPLLETWRAQTDSIYYATVKGHTLTDFPWDSLKARQERRRKEIEKDTLPDAVSNNQIYWDIKEIDFDFLTDHIDNAFKVWKESKQAKNLSFEEFKEYILPYRSIKGYGFLDTGKRYNELFGKYILLDSQANIRNRVEYYNTAINGLRDLNGKNHRTVLAGVYDLYSRDFHDCVDVASYGCNILRACGLPVVVEFNVCYRNLSGRHYHCSVYNDSIKKWETFNPESSLPGDGDWAFAETMNVYRMTYGAQKNTPYFLKNKEEYVPSILNSPCIKDVTSYLRHTVKINIPCKVETTNRLAYLATFHRESGGLLPVTWGRINFQTGRITFQNVLPNVLYFPVYYPSKTFQTFGQPFYVKEENGRSVICPIPGVDSSKDTLKSMILTRKYPRKPNMIQLAQELVGGRFLGANKRDFSDAQVLYEIKEAPQPYFLDYPFARKGKFQYYRFEAPAEHPHANISMLEWITQTRYQYTNAMPPSRVHILSPKDTLSLPKEATLVKLLDEDSWDKMKWKSEYDGNMQTSPGAYPTIGFNLKEPQIITGVRFAPRNADNGINSGDEFELYYWDNGWNYAGSNRAKYEYVEFNNVPKNKLYWIKNSNSGKEELLFVMLNGKRAFLYYEILNEVSN